MGEFNIIETYFSRLTMGKAEALSLKNDVAMMPSHKGMQYVVTTDTLNENVHFFEKTPPEIIAKKVLRTNLSDILSSGAMPHSYQLAIALPPACSNDKEWINSFTQSLLEDQIAANIYCSGGDTTASNAGLSITVTMFGLVPGGRCITRANARAGDVVIVTGEIGAGICAYKNGTTIMPPMHENAVATIVRDYASACVDVSDGLLADLLHIARDSDVRIDLNVYDVPIVGSDVFAALTGGDDYQLAMTVAAQQAHDCMQALRSVGADGAVIGTVSAGAPKLQLLDGNDQPLEMPKNTGWQHF